MLTRKYPFTSRFDAWNLFGVCILVIGYFLSAEGYAADSVFTDNLGVGTTAPTASLHIGAGSLKFPDGTTQSVAYTGSGSEGWATGVGKVYLTTSSDNVGIGTNSPVAKLHILSTAGQIKSSYDASNYVDLITMSNGRLSLSANGTTIFKLGNDPVAGAGTIWAGGIVSPAGNNYTWQAYQGSEIWMNAVSGGYIAVTVNNASTNVPITIVGANTGIGYNTPPVIPNLFSVNGASGFVGNIGIGITGASSARLDIVTAGISAGIGLRVRDNVNADRVVILDNGNVGIATTNPIYKLHVQGTLDATTVTEGGSVIDPGGWTASGSNVYLLTSADNIGIGTSSPAAGKLYIKGAGTTTGFSLRTADSSGADKFVILDNGNVGIATTAPVYKLQVNGTLDAAAITENGSSFSANGWTGSNSNIYLITSADNAGIGTSSPSQKLHIDGAIYIASNVPAPITNCLYNDTGTLKWSGSTLATSSTISGATGYIGRFSDSSTVNSSIGMFETADGNLGIGTTAPAAKLEVAGLITAGSNFNVNIPNSAGGNWITNADLALWTADHTGGTGDEAYIARYIRSGAATTLEIANKNDADDHIALMLYGNVGIGTTDPVYKLHIEGTLDAVAITQNGSPVGGGAWTASSGNVYLRTSSDNVGIGTSTPGNAKLYLQGTGTGPGFTLRVKDASGADKAVILDSGNVGIGTTLPNNLLTIGDYNTAYTSSQKQGLLSVDNVLLSNLEGGAYFGRVGVKENQWQIADKDYGTWVQKDSTVRTYRGIAMSSDGRIQTAVVSGGDYIYVSTDYGVTWTQRGLSRSYWSIAMSSDGRIQTVVVNGGGYIYVSTDYGVTWTQRGSWLNYYGIAMSSDGRIQTAVVSGGYIYVSTDYGDTWVQEDSTSRTYHCVAMSSDGKIQTAGVYGTTAGQGLYVSTDYGATWGQKESTATNWEAVAMSSDGRIQTAVVLGSSADGQGIYVSTDYGATWVQKDSIARSYFGIAMSSDGRIQTAVIYTGAGAGILVSRNYGATWVVGDNNPRYYTDVAMSSDGRIQTAVVSLSTSGQGIYSFLARLYTSGNVGIGKTSPTAPLDIRGAGTGSAFTLRVQDNADTDRVVILDNGNVGIGTTNPTAYKVHIEGTLDADSFSENGISLGGGGWKDGGADVYLKTSSNNVGIGTSTPGNAKLYIQGAGTGSGFALRTKDSTGADKVVILDNGNVGIGTTAPSAKLIVNGAIKVPVAGKTADYTITASDCILLGTPPNNNLDFNLPTAVGIAGREYTFKNGTTAKTLKVHGAGPDTETIDGAGYKTLAAGACIIVVSDGANWRIVSSYGTVT